jgi:OOP family OmpA-OmpF porin
MDTKQPRRPARGPVTLDDLRPLLIGPEQGRIQQIEERLDHHFEGMVAGVLPQAIAESRKSGEGLAYAFEPLVEQTTRKVISKEPAAFAEVLAPALGPAIRRAVCEVFEVALQRINAVLDRSLSLESLRWRIEARRTGRSFAEVALARTLVYRVEQLYLIHRESGLLLEHVACDGAPGQDPDQISAMLSALEIFTHEAFRANARLERFRVGELSGWVEHGPSAILCAIVRGTAPETYEGVLREALERTHIEYGAELVEFHGDAGALGMTHDLLSACLREHYRTPRRRLRVSPRSVGVLMLALCATLAAGLGLIARRSERDRQRFSAMVDALRSEPGIVVTAAGGEAGPREIAGLRDPLAEEPSAVLARHGLDPAWATLDFKPFYSLDPHIVGLRASRILRPPSGLALAFHESVLEARGVAPGPWIDRARTAALLVPGVRTFDDRLLSDEDGVRRARALARAIDGKEVHFAPASAVPWAEERTILDGVAAAAKELESLASAEHMTLDLDVVGFTDEAGALALNDELARARAESVVSELEERGVTGRELHERGGGVRADVPTSGPGAWRARSVVLRVRLVGPGS